MQVREYRRALARAKAELIDQLKERQRIDRRISQLKNFIYELNELSSERPCGAESITPSSARRGPKLGLTDAVRKTLQNAAPVGLSAVKVRQLVANQGFDFSRYRNPLASVHVVLNRIVEAGQADMEVKNGIKTYMWLTELDIALGLLETMEEKEHGSAKGKRS